MLRKLTTKTILTLAFILILLWASLSPMPQVAMRRESKTPDLIIQPGDLYTALDVSLAIGDGRRVNWEKVGF